MKYLQIGAAWEKLELAWRDKASASENAELARDAYTQAWVEIEALAKEARAEQIERLEK